MQHEGQKQMERRMKIAQEFNASSKQSWVINYRKVSFLATFSYESV